MKQSYIDQSKVLNNIEILFKNFDWSMYDVVLFGKMLWYGVVWNSIVFCSVLFCNIGYYIVVECIQSVFQCKIL